MLALKGYFNGKEFVALEKVEVKPNQKVIITILDEYVNVEDKEIPEEIKKKQKAVDKLYGLLKGEDAKTVKEFDEALSKKLTFNREVKDL